MSSLSPARAIAYGGLTVGVLDGLDAVVFFGLRGVPPLRIFQAIAAGLIRIIGVGIPSALFARAARAA